MADKHYGIDYLNNTGEVLKKIKTDSYKYFNTVRSGLVIDLGCGTGADVLHMARQLPDTVRLAGLDHDPAMISKAKEQAREQQLEGRVEFLVSEANQLPFAAASVAGIRAERLVQHLKTPEQVFEHLYELLIPGATLLVLEADWDSLVFYNLPLAQQKKLSHYLVEAKVNNGYAARRMAEYFRDSGFRQPGLDVFPFVFRSLKEVFTLLLIDQSLSEMQAGGLLGAGEYEELMQSLQTSDAGGCFVCSMNLIMMSGVK